MRSVQKIVSDFTKGLTSAISDKYAGFWKTLTNVERNKEFGGVEIRKDINIYPNGLDVNTLFSTGFGIPATLQAIDNWDNKSHYLMLVNPTDPQLWVNGIGRLYTNGNPVNVTPPELSMGAGSIYPENYGMVCAYDGNKHYIAFLSTLLQSANVRNSSKGDILVYDGRELPSANNYAFRLGYEAPSVSNILFGVTNQTQQPFYNVETRQFKYSFTYADSFITNTIESPIYEYGVEQYKPETMILHLQRNSLKTYAVGVTEIKVYHRKWGTGNTAESIEDVEYTLYATLNGSELDEREVGDDLNDNYVRFVYNFSGAGAEGGTLVEGDTFVIPKTAYVVIYNGRTFALGDVEYPNYVYFTDTSYTDFKADNNFILDIPADDPCLVCGAVLGNSLYVFSQHSTWRITETSTNLPYYTVEKVRGMEGIGCIAPKTLINSFGRLFFLSSEGFIEFNGSTYKILSTPIDDKIKELNQNYYDSTGKLVLYPRNKAVTFAPYNANATYDADTQSIYLSLPLTETEVYRYFIKADLWDKIEVPNYVGFVKGLEGKLAYFTNGSLGLKLTDTGTGKDIDIENTFGSAVYTDINCTLESIDIPFPDRTLFSSLVIYGTGTIDLWVYNNRSDTARVTKLSKTLSENGTEIPLNIQGEEIRYKIENVSLTEFSIKKVVLVYKSNGKKAKGDIE